jgi:hypothetical protein
MLRKTGVRAAALAVIVILSSTNLLAQRRISFRRGASSATVSGRIGGNGYTEYLIKGSAGQVMTIEISSGNGGVVVNAGSASGKSFSIEMTGGDHLLSIVNQGRSATTYRMTVSIR